MARGVLALVLGVTLTLLAGCDDSSAPVPDGTPSTTVTSPPPPTPDQALRALLREGADTALRATYVARQRRPRARATWEVWRTPTALRVDVVHGRQKATLIVREDGSYECRSAPGHKVCLRVAGPHRRIPARLRLAVGDLFSTDMRALARGAGSDYVVRAAPLRTALGPVDAVGCFEVHARKGVERRVPRGTYCFERHGVLTSVRYPTGNTAALQQLRTQRPDRAAFRPYSSPTPLPG